MRHLLLALLIFQLSFSTALAQSDTSSFFIRVFGSDDVVAPSTPTLSSAIPVSIDQIDLSWTTSTDNFLVSGYVLYRNGLPLSTTTLTSYSDSGLTASTTYSYYVKAFDPSFNYSSSSNILSATTLDTPPMPENSDSGGGTATRVVLNNLTITPEIYSARLAVQTVRPARFEIRWGRTDAYELGYTVNDKYVKDYSTNLTGLEPGTKYQYEVIGFTPLGNPTVLERGHFSTLSLQDFLPPANVSQFTAIARGSDVALRYITPVEEYSYVRIVRSHLGFPAHLEDGVVVYQGRDTSVLDKNALKEYSPAYYTVFVVDTAGNVSSGAVARVYYIEAGSVPDSGPQQPPIHTGGPISSPELLPSASTSRNVAPGTRMPGLGEIFLQQGDIRSSFADEDVRLDAELSFLISIPKTAISENLKTIIVSITDPSDSRQSYSFILRLNKDGTAYEAVLSALMLEGQSRLVIDIYDYESSVVATYQKSISFKRVQKEMTPVFPDLFIENSIKFAPILAGATLLFFFFFLLYRRHRRTYEDNAQ